MLSCLLILICPLIGAILASFFGRYFGMLGASFITLIYMSFSLFFSIITIYKIGFLQIPVYFILGSWVQVDMLSVN